MFCSEFDSSYVGDLRSAADFASIAVRMKLIAKTSVVTVLTACTVVAQAPAAQFQFAVGPLLERRHLRPLPVQATLPGKHLGLAPLHTELTVLWVAHQYLPESSAREDRHETTGVFDGEHRFRKASERAGVTV